MPLLRCALLAPPQARHACCSLTPALSSPALSESQIIGDALCSSPAEGGDALVSALGAGGEAAQAAMKALLTGDCSNVDAKEEAVSAFGGSEAMNDAASVMA